MKDKQFPMKWSAIIAGGIFGLIAGLGVIANWWQPFASQAVNHVVGILSGLLIGSFVGFLAYDWKEVYRAIPKAFRACVFGFSALIGAFNSLFVIVPKSIWKDYRYHVLYAIIWSLPYSIGLPSFFCTVKTLRDDNSGLYGIISSLVIVSFIVAMLIADLLLNLKMQEINKEEYMKCPMRFKRQIFNELTKEHLMFYPKLIGYILYGIIGLTVFMAIFPFKFIYSLVYHTWSAPRLFHAIFSGLCVGVGYPIGIGMNAVLPAIGIGVAVGLISAKITHHYLAKRKTELRPLSWNPFRIFVNGQAG